MTTPKALMTEAKWQGQVVTLARALGWECFHAPDNKPGAGGRRQTVTPGWLDLVLLGHSRALFVELKSEKGRIRPEQVVVMDKLRAAGCEVSLWRPSDLPTVKAVLGPQQLDLRSVA